MYIWDKFTNHSQYLQLVISKVYTDADSIYSMAPLELKCKETKETLNQCLYAPQSYMNTWNQLKIMSIIFSIIHMCKVKYIWNLIMVLFIHIANEGCHIRINRTPY